MINNENNLEGIISNFVRDFQSPTKDEKFFVQKEYERLDGILEGQIFQGGSYARFTAITPLNDLDVFWVLSEETDKTVSSDDLFFGALLDSLAKKLKQEYESQGVDVKTEAQVHSVKIEFINEDSDFTIDIVPARKLDEPNGFGDYLYEIPKDDAENKIKWVKTDPKGYIELAKRVNEKSSVFRKATKLLKAWKTSWKKKKNFGGVEFKFQSFHLELVVQKIIADNTEFEILDVADYFFKNISSFINEKQFVDRAGNGYVDDYLDELTKEEKRMIQVAARSAKILVDRIKIEKDKAEIIKLLHRIVAGEEFIEAYGYSVPDNKITSPAFHIFARKNNEPEGSRSGIIELDFNDEVRFRGDFLSNFNYSKVRISKYLYKVLNTGEEATKAKQSRGEISEGSTLNVPEKAVFKGVHFVECYAVNDQTKTVIAYAICSVVIGEKIIRTNFA